MAIGTDIQPAAQPAAQEQQSAPRSRGSDLQWLQTVSRRVAWAIVAVALVVGVALVGVWAGVGDDSPTRGDIASTARLEQQAEQYEMARQARSSSASAARYTAAADQVRTSRRNAAATARLDAAAERHAGYEVSLRARSQAATSDRLTRQADAAAGG